MKKNSLKAMSAFVLCAVLMVGYVFKGAKTAFPEPPPGQQISPFNKAIRMNAKKMLREGRHTFRRDTFGDEAFWGGQLQLHQAISGSKLGGVGPGLSPKMALELGLKVSSPALPPDLIAQLKNDKVNLDDPAVTLALLQLDAVVGVNPPSAESGVEKG